MKNTKIARLPYAAILTPFLFILLLTSGLRTNGQRISRVIADAWMFGLNKHDTIGLAALYDDSARILSPNWEGERTGKAAVREIYRRYFTGTPDLQHRLTHLLCTDTCIMLEYVSSGTFEHPEPGTPAYMQGKRYELQNCTRLDLRNGKIIRQINYFDQVAFLRQVGFFEHLGN